MSDHFPTEVCRETYFAKAQELLVERRALEAKIKEARRRHAATGVRSDWNWFLNTEARIEQLKNQERELQFKGAALPRRQEITIGQKYRFLCQAIEAEFGPETLRGLVLRSNDLWEADRIARESAS